MDPTVPAQVGVATLLALARVTAVVLAVAVLTGGAAAVVTVFVVKGLTGHRLYESTKQSVGTGSVLGFGTVCLYVLTLAVFEWAAAGKTEFLVVLGLVVLAGVGFVARPLYGGDRDHAVGRATLAVTTVLVFLVAFMVALLFAYPVVLSAVQRVIRLI